MGPRAFAKMDDGAPASSPAPLKPTKLEMFHELRPFLLPKFGHLRIRILIVFSLIIGVRACNIYIPILFKDTIDSLSAVQPSLPIFSIALYASLRFLVSIQRDIRSLFWLPVEQYTRRSISLYVFRHLHSLSLRFHLNRKTVHKRASSSIFFRLILFFQGEVLRVIERGTTSIETLFNTIVFSIGPTLFDVGTVCVVFVSYGESVQAAIVFVTIVLYCGLTWVLTEWRTKFRQQQNEADNKSDQKAIDSLLNFETVKYFTGEEMEARQYERVTKKERAVTFAL
jgi:ABC-type multidrug transport system fused ATPase/permease subunit